MMGTMMQIAEGKIMTQSDKNETPLNLTSEQNKPNTLHHSGTKILSNYHIIHISIYYSKTYNMPSRPITSLLGLLFHRSL